MIRVALIALALVAFAPSVKADPPQALQTANDLTVKYALGWVVYAGCVGLNNKWSLRAYDDSEKKNQPAPVACVKP